MSTVVAFQEREVKSYNSVKFIELIILTANVLLSNEVHWYKYCQSTGVQLRIINKKLSTEYDS